MEGIKIESFFFIDSELVILYHPNRESRSGSIPRMFIVISILLTTTYIYLYYNVVVMSVWLRVFIDLSQQQILN